MEEQYENIVKRLPSECSELSLSDNGVHNGLIVPPTMRRPIMAKCHGPWTVIQKREDGSVDFNRSWEEYATGFGEADGELWIGNEVLHQLTKDNCTTLRIIIQDLQNNTWYVHLVIILATINAYAITFSQVC